MTMPTTGRFNCRSPFRRFIVERCTGAVAALTQLSSAQPSAAQSTGPSEEPRGDCGLRFGLGLGLRLGLALDGAVISAGLTEPINNRAECHA